MASATRAGNVLSLAMSTFGDNTPGHAGQAVCAPLSPASRGGGGRVRAACPPQRRQPVAMPSAVGVVVAGVEVVPMAPSSTMRMPQVLWLCAG
jgi:hypothetical protein